MSRLPTRELLTGVAWGADPGERHAPSPVDGLVPAGAERWVRAVDVAAPAALVFRWLCQFRAAPYSYDVLDNLGRRSPQELTPGLDELAPGQRFLLVFALHGFEPGRRLVLEGLARSRRVPRMAMHYEVAPRGEGACRLVVRIAATPPPALAGTRLGALLLRALAVGDQVMVRRQLLNVRALAERDARRAAAA